MYHRHRDVYQDFFSWRLVVGNGLEGDVGLYRRFPRLCGSVCDCIQTRSKDQPYRLSEYTRKGGRQQPLARVAELVTCRSDPTAAPMFGNECCRSRTTCGIQYKIARIGGHEHAALNYAVIGLNNIELIVCKPRYPSVIPVILETARIENHPSVVCHQATREARSRDASRRTEASWRLCAICVRLEVLR